MYWVMQSMSVSSKPDLTNIRLHKFSISACCSTVILLRGTCLIASHNLCLKISAPRVRKKSKLSTNTSSVRVRPHVLSLPVRPSVDSDDDTS